MIILSMAIEGNGKKPGLKIVFYRKTDGNVFKQKDNKSNVFIFRFIGGLAIAYLFIEGVHALGYGP